TVVANGQTERAVGWLRSDWEIAAPGTGTGSGRGSESVKNQPPTLTLSSGAAAKVNAPLQLTATVTDDGLPPTAGRGRALNTRRAPAFDNPELKSTVPTTVREVERPAPPRVDARLRVPWFVWRGPENVTFTPPVAGADGGQAVVTATFTKPG